MSLKSMIASASVAVLGASGLRIQLAEGSAPCKVGDKAVVSCPDPSGCIYKDGEEGFWAEDAAEYDQGHEDEPIFVGNKSTVDIVSEPFGDGNFKVAFDNVSGTGMFFATEGEVPYTNKYIGESTTFVMHECYSP